MYVADRDSNRVRRISTSDATVSTLAGSDTAGWVDNVGALAVLNGPKGLAIDSSGTYLYLTERVGHRIRRVVISTQQVTTVAGSGAANFSDGVGTFASFQRPAGIVCDPTGAFLYVADLLNHRIRMIVLATGNVTTIAGSSTAGYLDGTGTSSLWNQPDGIAIDSIGSALYVSDYNHRIRKVNLATQLVSTVAGSGQQLYRDGVGTSAALNMISGGFLTLDVSSNVLYLAEYSDYYIRRIDLNTLVVSTIAGSGAYQDIDGIGSLASFGGPYGVVLSPTGALFVTEFGNNIIRKVSLVPAACQAGYFCPAGSGVSTGSGLCPAGFYCIAGTSAPQTCVGGSYCSAGASSVSGTALCAAGMYCAAGSSSPAAQLNCSAGFFCPANSSSASGAGPCAPGSYCLAGSSSATQALVRLRGEHRASTESPSS